MTSNFCLNTATLLLVLAMVPCGVAVLRSKSTAASLAALQLAGVVSTVILLLLAVGYRRPSSADVGLSMAVLSYPAGLVFAHFLERWL